MSLARVQFFSVSLDGFGTGEVQSLEAPFGHAGERLHEWMFVTRWWHQRVGEPGGSGGIDDAFLRLHDPGVGAEIMGAGKFGPPGWHEDPEWKGWWGPNPPFHTPTFILTHHPRPSIEMEGGTTFHFIDASPAEALETAREAAGGQDVRLGGGVTMIREFLAAGLVDHMHIAVVPILLGRGERLWDGLEGLEKDYEIEATSSPSGVTHVTFTRAAVEGEPVEALGRLAAQCPDQLECLLAILVVRVLVVRDDPAVHVVDRLAHRVDVGHRDPVLVESRHRPVSALAAHRLVQGLAHRRHGESPPVDSVSGRHAVETSSIRGGRPPGRGACRSSTGRGRCIRPG